MVVVAILSQRITGGLYGVVSIGLMPNPLAAVLAFTASECVAHDRTLPPGIAAADDSGLSLGGDSEPAATKLLDNLSAPRPFQRILEGETEAWQHRGEEVEACMPRWGDAEPLGGDEDLILGDGGMSCPKEGGHRGE